MSVRTFKAWLVAGAVVAVVTPVFASAAEQIVVKRTRTMATAEAQKNFKPAKNQFGQPDLEGTWTNATLTTLARAAEYGDRLVMTEDEARKVEGSNDAYLAERNKASDPSLSVKELPDCGRGFTGVGCGYDNAWTDPGETVMRVRGEPRTSFLTTANGRVPARKAGAPAPAARGAMRPGMSQNDNPETRSPGERCILSFGNSAGPVMLPLLYNNNYQFVQTKDEVAILVEMVHDVRHIRLNGSHRTDGVRPYFGDSIGRYEGNTLVVETTNFPRMQAFQGSWENLKVTEKFTRVAPDRMLYQFTVEDPTIWDTAWGGEYEFGKSDGMVYEYACHEGNYALEGILAGARAEEAAAAAQTASAPAK